MLSTPLAVPITPVCWSTPRKTKPSEVQVLLTEELQDDESGDDEDFIPYYEKQTGQGIEKDEVTVLNNLKNCLALTILSKFTSPRN